MLYSPQAKTSSLYIHWPFCPYKCAFCPFVAISGQDFRMGEYHEALKKELKRFALAQQSPQPIETIYIGGGTPSTWPDQLLLDMFGTLRSTFDMCSISEISLELNPGTVRREQLAVWKACGITRLSIGVQSLNDQVLQNLNRAQSAAQVRELLGWLSETDFNVSVDIIVGLPGVTESEWKAFVEELITWPIHHVSMYFLSVHEGTPLFFKIARNQITLPPDEATVDLYYWSVNALKEGGFERYEVSSFAKPDRQSRHNQVYWQRKPFKGLGVGAWSFDGEKRIQNPKHILNYLEAQKEDKDVAQFVETVSPEAARLERVMLGLRCVKGCSLEEATEGLSSEKQQLFWQRLDALQEKKIVTVVNGRIFLSPSSLAIENEVSGYLSVE